MYVNQRAERLSDYTQSLGNKIYFIERYETSGNNDDISFVYINLSDIESLNRTYEFHSIYYWFTDMHGEAVSYIKESATDMIKVFNNSGPEWTDGRKTFKHAFLKRSKKSKKFKTHTCNK